MWRKFFFHAGFLAALLALAALAPAAAKSPQGSPSAQGRPQLIRIDLAGDQKQPVSGRLLIFAIPKAAAEKQAHDGKVTYAKGRFLLGHSSGGWAVLWLQTRYPKMFGGCWSTAPDPSDFHDFLGTDLYAVHANVYRKSDGILRPMMRMHGKVVATFEQFAKLERVMGPYGGQLASLEWVFSPRGKDGRPEEMFNRDTGAVDPNVVEYWRDHYDIAHRLQTHWPQLKPYLNGKIHLYVGTADTFYLDGSARKLKAVLDGLHAKSDIHFLPGKTHFADLYAKGKDKNWLLKQMVWQMYHVARPHVTALKMMPMMEGVTVPIIQGHINDSGVFVSNELIDASARVLS